MATTPQPERPEDTPSIRITLPWDSFYADQLMAALARVQEMMRVSRLRAAIGELELLRATDCDSEALALAVHQACLATKGRLCALFAEAVTQVRAAAPTASQAIDAAVAAASADCTALDNPN